MWWGEGRPGTCSGEETCRVGLEYAGLSRPKEDVRTLHIRCLGGSTSAPASSIHDPPIQDMNMMQTQVDAREASGASGAHVSVASAHVVDRREGGYDSMMHHDGMGGLENADTSANYYQVRAGLDPSDLLLLLCCILPGAGSVSKNVEGLGFKSFLVLGLSQRMLRV
jgi:hypothetical protein